MRINIGMLTLVKFKKILTAISHKYRDVATKSMIFQLSVTYSANPSRHKLFISFHINPVKYIVCRKFIFVKNLVEAFCGDLF